MRLEFAVWGGRYVFLSRVMGGFRCMHDFAYSSVRRKEWVCGRKTEGRYFSMSVLILFSEYEIVMSVFFYILCAWPCFICKWAFGDENGVYDSRQKDYIVSLRRTVSRPGSLIQIQNQDNLHIAFFSESPSPPPYTADSQASKTTYFHHGY